MGNNTSRGKVKGKQAYRDKRKSREKDLEGKSINDVPNEDIKPREAELEVKSINDVPTEDIKSIVPELEIKSINDVPNEIIQKNIMTYLSNDDVSSFGMTGSKRFKVIADDELEKRRK